MPPRFQRFFFRTAGPAATEWDKAKSAWTLANRGFDFGFASQTLRGEVLRRRDTRHHNEDVFQVIGEVSGAVLFVVYTARHGRIRIISARLATPDEARLYHGRNH